MYKAIKAIATTMNGVREQAKVTEEDIHSSIDLLIAAVTAMLRDREVALISHVETMKRQKEKELQLQKDELEFLMSEIRHAVLFSEALVKEGSEIEIVASHQQVVTRMATLTKEREKAQLEPVTDTEVKFEGVLEGTELLNSVIKGLGAVVGKGISAAHSIIERPTGTNHLINQGYSFQVILKDKTGNKASTETMSKAVKGLAVELTGSSKVKVCMDTLHTFFNPSVRVCLLNLKILYCLVGHH